MPARRRARGSARKGARALTALLIGGLAFAYGQPAMAQPPQAPPLSDLSVDLDGDDRLVGEEHRDHKITVTVRNAGPGQASNVRVKIRPPKELEIEDVSPSVCDSSHHCELGNLAAGQEAVLTVRGEFGDPGRMNTWVFVTSDSPDADLDDNQARQRGTVAEDRAGDDGGSGSGRAGDDVDTAEGKCTFAGRLEFDEPVGTEARETSFTDFAEGLCTGTVNGKFLEDERVFLRAEGSGLLSCGANLVTDTGTFFYTRNTATRKDDVEIDYIAESQGVFGNVASRVRGRVSGEVASVLRFRGDERTLRECEAGEFEGGEYDVTGTTIRPLRG